jgi:hypothetical protein
LKRKGTRITSLLLVIALVLTLLPPFTAFADAARIDINSLYVSPVKPVGADDNKVQRLTNNPISITAYINNISDAQVPNIYYEVFNVNTNSTVTEKMNKALLSGNQITFNNVYLSEGLNRITIMLGETSVISSAPGWAYFTPVTNISKLLVNNAPFEEGKMYPENMTAASTSTSLTFTGKANNATDVQAIVTGDPTPVSNYFVNGDFVMSAEHVSKKNNSLANMFLKAGDNRIAFIAKNSSNTYRLERQFVYDNGFPFAFNAKIAYDKDKNAATPDVNEYLIDQPSVTDAQVTLTAKIKVPLVPNSVTATVYDPQYPIVTIKAADGSADTYDLTLASNTHLNKDPALAASDTSLTRMVGEGVAGKYQIYSYTRTVDLTAGSSIASKNKFLDYTFTNPAISTMQPINSAYSFYYTDTALPYILAVNMGLTDAYAGATKDPGVKLNETSTNAVNEMPKKLRIFTDRSDSSGVKVYLDGAAAPTSTLTPVAATETSEFFTTDPSSRLFIYQLEGLGNGTHTLQFVPLALDGTENLAGAKLFEFTITSAPYVILDNIYNGLILKKTNTVSCGTLPIDCLSGRFVNVPENELQNIEISFNDGVPMKFNKTDYTSGGDFTDLAVSRFQFRYNSHASRTSKLQEGRNIIKIFIYSGGKLVSQASYEVFVYSTDAPDFIGSISPGPVTPSERELFPSAKTVDAYSTNETQVVFTGRFTGATSLKVTARSKNTDGLPIYMTQAIDISSKVLTPSTGPESNDTSGTFALANIFTGSSVGANDFSTQPIKLNPKGDTIFEFEITNASNIKIIRTVTISREPLPYKFTNLENLIIKNEKNEDQVNINSNFQTILLEAEFADKVVFGKEEAYKTPGTYNFTYEAKNLKPGKNTVKFTVFRGTDKTNGSLVLYNIDTPMEGASYKTKLASTTKVFDGQLELKFPKDTSLMRNEESNNQQYLTTDRELLFGIANPRDGRVDKLSEFSNDTAITLLREPTLRFRAASKLFWIDTGTIGPYDYMSDLEKALKGSGRLPYEGFNFYSRQPKDLVVPTSRGSITLKYDPSIRDNAWKYLTVYHFGYYENKNGQIGPMWKNVGGVVNPSNNTINVAFNAPGYYQVMYMGKSFQDVTNHPWAREDLDTLYTKGYMVNKTTSSFIPNDFITRGEFTTLLVKIFDIPLNYDNGLSFEDVGLLKMDDLSDYKYIETAARAGIVRGITETQFMPNMSITRQDAAVMIARAAEMKLSSDPVKSLTNLQKLFTDANGIDLYARTSVEAITKAGFIEGKANVLLQGQKKATVRFDPLESFTRAEAAVVAIRVLKQQGKIPK